MSIKDHTDHSGEETTSPGPYLVAKEDGNAESPSRDSCVSLNQEEQIDWLLKLI